MRSAELQRRQAALDQHDAAMARWPQHGGQAFEQQMREVVRDLETIAREADRGDPDELERSRTWRYLGDAYFDLAAGKDATLLQEGVAAYRRAEALLENAESPVDRAKLDFNLANTLRGLGGAADRPLLEEARRRYGQALETFSHHAPQFVAQVKANIAMLAAQLTILGVHEETLEKVKTLEGIRETLERSGAGSTLESERQAQRGLRRFKLAGGSTAAAQRRTQQAIEESGNAYRDAAAAIGMPDQEIAASDRTAEMQRMLAAVATSGQGDDGAARFRHVFGLVRARFRHDVDANVISPARQRALEWLLGDLETLLDQEPVEVADLTLWLGRLRELMAQVIPLMTDPSTGEGALPADSRAALLHRFARQLVTFIAGEITRPNVPTLERQAALELLSRASAADTELDNFVHDEAKLLAFENDVLRPLHVGIDAYALRHHPVLAPAAPPPVWPTLARVVDPNAVFFAGRADVRALVEEACQARRLAIHPEVRGRGDVGQARWDDLRTSHLAVFDVGEKVAPNRAAVCYELGLARATGRPTVILAPSEMTIPFDVDTEPFRLAGAPEDGELIGEAIDAAMYTPQRRQSEPSVRETIAYARTRFGGADATFDVRQILELLDDASGDAIESRRNLGTLLGFIRQEEPYLLYPAWPGSYPTTREHRCFHVMPFSLAWSDEVSRIAADACSGRATYVRGDAVADSRVIRSIWNEICRASHVLVDLTEFNPNVSLELGMAHALGRNVLMVGQGDTVRQLFPSIKRLRVGEYALERGGQSLHRMVAQFVRT